MRLFVAPAALAVVLVATACSNGRVFRIPSSSMEPTLHCAKPGAGCTAKEMDRVQLLPDKRPKRGDIVAFDAPAAAALACGGGGGVFAKRVIGLPGEKFSERNGFIYIDGRKLREPYVKPNRRDSDTIPARKIARRSYFMLGDNRSSSCDSRRWGSVPAKNIIGRVSTILRGGKTIAVP